jgi:hypothetical protein
LALVLSSVYIVVTIFLLIRFIKNGLQLYKRAKSNESIAFNNAKLVLLPNPTLPYTFFEYHICIQRRLQNRKLKMSCTRTDSCYSKNTL